MRFLFATYRWGEDLLGGAEVHHRRLAQELVDAGHHVSVLTTTGHDIRAFCHWGVEWTELSPIEREAAYHLKLYRLPLSDAPRWQKALMAKAVQFRAEREERGWQADALEALWPESSPALHLLSGWHHAELMGGAIHRWAQGLSRLGVRNAAPARLVIRGYAPKANLAEIRDGGRRLLQREVAPGSHTLEVELEPGRRILELGFANVWRPLRDFRGLTFLVNSVELHAEGGVVCADLWEDLRALGRANPQAWQALLLARAEARPRVFDAMINRLRGPRAAHWRAAIAEANADAVIHCNMPWATMDAVRPGDLAMPLWHVEDDYYYWRSWIEGLRRARFALANTPYTAEQFFPGIGVKAHFVGPPIWPPEEFPSPAEAAAFRARHDIAPDDVLVLAVCRKSAEKRYDAIAASVARLRARGLPVRMVGVGPDIDQRPFAFDGCAWTGKLGEEELQTAYAACDIFALMSESESFGMVIPEAWHHGKPVVVNRLCGPSASIVENGRDGLLAAPGVELDGALERLASSAETRTELGARGKEKARRLYVRGAAAGRLLEAMGAGR